jgi:hypothetical protein
MAAVTQAFTCRRYLTAGDIQRSLEALGKLRGLTLISINWKKRKAKFRTLSGVIVFRSL